jgi:putative dimethyl sulfoxide reductase chaperone
MNTSYTDSPGPALPTPDTRDPASLVERAALFRVLARAFSDPRCADTVDLARELDEAAHRTGSEVLGHAARAWGARDPEAIAREYTRLFLAGTPCPPHQTAWGDGRRMAGRPAELADLGGFYRAFGLRVSRQHPDLPDHLATELEFLSLLLLKAAWAEVNGWDEPLAITRDATRLFLEHHLGRWLPAFEEGLATASAASPFPELARAVATEIEHECRAAGAEPVPVEGGPIDDPMQKDGFECPMATGSPEPATGPRQRRNRAADLWSSGRFGIG